MALLGFKKQFVPKIETGFKRHTIRGDRVVPIKLGETLHLYASPRTKQMKLIFRSTCIKIQEIKILMPRPGYCSPILIDGHLLDIGEAQQLAAHDGFESFAEMMQFWEGRLPFTGVIIHWAFPPDKPKEKK